VGVDTAKLTAAEIAAILEALRPGFDSGALKPPMVRAWPLADAIEAYRAVAAGDVSAKQILVPRRR
jgi:NADPH:quinone reductase-like Zn-dependent oxidoreductase